MISTENTDKKSRGHKDTESPELWVTAPQLKSLEIGGAVTFDAKDIQGPSLAIEVEGVSKVSLDRVKGDVVELNVSGVCSYKGNIEGGSVTVNNAGSGSIKSDIQADNLLLNNSGATTFKGNFKGKGGHCNQLRCRKHYVECRLQQVDGKQRRSGQAQTFGHGR